MEKIQIETTSAPKPGGPYSQVNIALKYILIFFQIASPKKTRTFIN